MFFQDNPGRSRANSFSSSIGSVDSTIPNLFGNYQTPPRKHYPPSDIGDVSESDLDDSYFTDLPVSPAQQSGEAKKLNKLLDIYKNKFAQLKEAYAESEAEKEKIKKVGIMSSGFYSQENKCSVINPRWKVKKKRKDTKSEDAKS